MKAACHWIRHEPENGEERFSFSATVDGNRLMFVDNILEVDSKYGIDNITTCKQVQFFVQRLCKQMGWEFELTEG